jgi:hypothetical protein
MDWPNGTENALRLTGLGRDAVTGDASIAPDVIATSSISVAVAMDRTIVDIAAEPPDERISELVGSRGGGHLRSAIDEHLPGERDRGTLLHLLLDDISGTSLIARFALARHPYATDTRDDRLRSLASMEGVCIGFAPGSSALDADRVGGYAHHNQPVTSLVNPEDPQGWHTLHPAATVSMRRASRIDVCRADRVRRRARRTPP